MRCFFCVSIVNLETDPLVPAARGVLRRIGLHGTPVDGFRFGRRWLLVKRSAARDSKQLFPTQQIFFLV